MENDTKQRTNWKLHDNYIPKTLHLFFFLLGLLNLRLKPQVIDITINADHLVRRADHKTLRQSEAFPKGKKE